MPEQHDAHVGTWRFYLAVERYLADRLAPLHGRLNDVTGRAEAMDIISDAMEIIYEHEAGPELRCRQFGLVGVEVQKVSEVSGRNFRDVWGDLYLGCTRLD